MTTNPHHACNKTICCTTHTCTFHSETSHQCARSHLQHPAKLGPPTNLAPPCRSLLRVLRLLRQLQQLPEQRALAAAGAAHRPAAPRDTGQVRRLCVCGGYMVCAGGGGVGAGVAAGVKLVTRGQCR